MTYIVYYLNHFGGTNEGGELRGEQMVKDKKYKDIFFSFSQKCDKCFEVKNKMKFKRFNSFKRTCNECFLSNRSKSDE